MPLPPTAPNLSPVDPSAALRASNAFDALRSKHLGESARQPARPRRLEQLRGDHRGVLRRPGTPLWPNPRASSQLEPEIGRWSRVKAYPNQIVTTRLKKRWERLADAGAPLDIVEELERFTVDVTTLITFGHDLNTVEQGDDIIQRKLEIVLPAFNRRLFALFPTWRLVRLPRDRRLDRALAELRAWLGELVAAERTRLAAEPGRAEQPSNFLEAMVSARDDEGRPFSDDVIFGNLMTMLLAGEDTTAYALGWVVHLLCDSPESVMELRQEADGSLGTSDVAGDIETANKLAFAGAVANEAMRLRPITPVVVILEAKVETVVGDLLVPGGTRVFVLSRPAAYDPDRFAEPQAFRPRRWLGETTGAHDVAAHIPFGSGPRICPGRTLALLEMKLLLSMLYRNFNVERVGSADGVRENFRFVVSPVGLKVRLRRRSSALAGAGTA
jgi:cytochrome P450